MTPDHTLIVVASPQSLIPTRPWNKIIFDAALRRSMLKCVFVD